MGHDWAIGLATDEAMDVPSDGAVTVVLREFPRALQNETYVARITRLMDELEDALGRTVRFLPFCPEDERFLEELALAAHRPVDVHWWNPRRVQQHIHHASLVVSVGRFHPLVFAANVGTPAIYLEPLPEDPRWPASEKAQRWCRRTGQPYVASWEEAFERQPWRTAAARPAVSVGEKDHERWAHMVENVRSTFLAGSRRREG